MRYPVAEEFEFHRLVTILILLKMFFDELSLSNFVLIRIHRIEGFVVEICARVSVCFKAVIYIRVCPGNTKGGSITVPLTSCLTGLESAV